MKVSTISVMVFLAAVVSCSLVTSTNVADPSTHYCTENNTCTALFNNSFCNFDAKQQCDTGVCSCLSTHVAVAHNQSNPEDFSCLPKAAGYPGTCEHNLQCTSRFGNLSYCLVHSTGSRCDCEDDSVFDFGNSIIGACRPIRKLGENCDHYSHAQCNHISGAMCIESSTNLHLPYRCGCSTGTVEALNGSACIPVATKIGDQCDLSPHQCKTIPSSICDQESKTCICDDSAFIASSRNNSCLPKRPFLNMTCTEHIQCMATNSTCEYVKVGDKYQNICFCKRFDGLLPSVVRRDACVEIAKVVGDPCTEDIQCTDKYRVGPNGECSKNNTCQCKQGYAFHRLSYDEFGQCWPVVPLGGKCRWEQQCVDASGSNSNTDCRNDVCQCTNGEEGGLCYKWRMLGDPCDLDVECKSMIAGPVLCDYDTKSCKCDEGYYSSSNNKTCSRTKS